MLVDPYIHVASHRLHPLALPHRSTFFDFASRIQVECATGVASYLRLPNPNYIPYQIESWGNILSKERPNFGAEGAMPENHSEFSENRSNEMK